MCGIVGLHLRNPELVPQLGRLLTGMLCEMADRGSDSAGVAVYGDPVWSPVGQGCVSVLDVDPDSGALTEALGHPVTVTRIGDTINEIDDTTQKNAALVEESAAAAESLKQQADRLAQVVSTFRINGRSVL